MAATKINPTYRIFVMGLRERGWNCLSEGKQDLYGGACSLWVKGANENCRIVMLVSHGDVGAELFAPVDAGNTIAESLAAADRLVPTPAAANAAGV